jgi:5-methylcytosine-specific restriction endonuclease McrA
MRRTRVTPASQEQRAKILTEACLVCVRRSADPAHLVPRSLGGCDEPACVVPLCRRCHRAFDRGQLDLLPHLEPRFRAELAHGLLHLGLLGLLRRVTSARGMTADLEEDSSRAA